MNKNISLSYVVNVSVLAILPSSVWAFGMLGGNGVMLQSNQNVQVGVEFQKIENAGFAFDATSANFDATVYGNGSARVPENVSSLTSEVLLIRGDYAVSNGINLFGKVGTTKDKGNLLRSNPGNLVAVGARYVPVQDSLIKVGLSLQGMYVGEKGARDSVPANATPTYANTSIYNARGNAQDKLQYQRYDALLNVSFDTRYVTPYLGILFTYINGEYSSKVEGNATANTCTPTCSSTSTHFIYTENRKVSNPNLIGAIFGISLNQNEQFGFNLETRFGQGFAYVGSAVARF
ncbi:MAG: hypothetical protein AABY83_01310 [Pseudomonadota bacterium]